MRPLTLAALVAATAAWFAWVFGGLTGLYEDHELPVLALVWGASAGAVALYRLTRPKEDR